MVKQQDWQRLGGLFLRARRNVAGLQAGGHGSVRLGEGLDFQEYRAYVPGDEVVEVDWKLWGRSDRLFVRRRRRTGQMKVHLVVDASASMGFAGVGESEPGQSARDKFAVAAELAASIAFLAVRQGDRVGLSIVQPEKPIFQPAQGTWTGLMELCRRLEEAKPQGRVDGAELWRRAEVEGKGADMAVLIGDFLEEEELERGLKHISQGRGEKIVFQILSPAEWDIGVLGNESCLLMDSETGQQIATVPSETAPAYREAIRRYVRGVHGTCLACGVDHELVRTDEAVIKTLGRYLARRGR